MTNALTLIDWIKTEINRIHKHRDQLTRDFSRAKRPHPMQIYDLLPGKNCGLCGESTCQAFSVKLLNSEQTLKKCQPLYREGYQEAREAIANIIPQKKRVSPGESE